MDDLKTNYRDYMITKPIHCNEEPKRVPDADYELCTALISMLLIGDYSNESLDHRFMEKQVLIILTRMYDILSAGV